MTQRILLFCAHPDDEVLGAGATIAKYTKEGNAVTVIIFSYGEKSHWWLKEKYTKEIRVKEAKTAGKLLGVKETLFLGLGDMKLPGETKREEVRIKVKEFIEKIHPQKIFTHSIDDAVYPDHKAVYRIIESVTRQLSYRPEVYTFDIWNPINIRHQHLPKLYVDVTATFRLKLKALGLFHSQRLAIFQLMPFVLIRAFKHGLASGCRFAERFYKIQ